MSSAFNVNGCFILQRKDVSKALCKSLRVGEMMDGQTDGRVGGQAGR